MAKVDNFDIISQTFLFKEDLRPEIAGEMNTTIMTGR